MNKALAQLYSQNAGRWTTIIPKFDCFNPWLGPWWADFKTKPVSLKQKCIMNIFLQPSNSWCMNRKAFILMTDCFKTAAFSPQSNLAFVLSCNFNQFVWRSARAPTFSLGINNCIDEGPIEAGQATCLHRAASISFSAIHSNQVATKRHCVSPRAGQALSIKHRERPVRSVQSYGQSDCLRDVVPACALERWGLAWYTLHKRWQVVVCLPLAEEFIYMMLDLWHMFCKGFNSLCFWFHMACGNSSS